MLPWSQAILYFAAILYGNAVEIFATDKYTKHKKTTQLRIAT